MYKVKFDCDKLSNFHYIIGGSIHLKSGDFCSCSLLIDIDNYFKPIEKLVFDKSTFQLDWGIKKN